MNKNMQNGEKLKLTFQGDVSDGESVRLADLIYQLNAVKGLLNALDENRLGFKKPSLFYRVVGMSMNSPASIEIDATPKEGQLDISSDVFRDFINGLKMLGAGEMPFHTNDAVLKAYKELGGPLKRNLLSMNVEFANESVDVPQDISQRVNSILGLKQVGFESDHVEITSIRGNLELIDLHNKKNLFKIYPIIGAKFIKCSFPDHLLPKAVNALNRFVRVQGEAHTKSGEKFPSSMQIYDIEVLSDSSEIPSLSSLKGFANTQVHFNQSTSEIINEVMDEW